MTSTRSHIHRHGSTVATAHHIFILLKLHLSNTYFHYTESFYRQKQGCAMGLLVPPIVANIYVEEGEARTHLLP